MLWEEGRKYVQRVPKAPEIKHPLVRIMKFDSIYEVWKDQYFCSPEKSVITFIISTLAFAVFFCDMMIWY
jgi:hypothetical protein